MPDEEPWLHLRSNACLQASSAPHYLGLHLTTFLCTSSPSSAPRYLGLHLTTFLCTSLPSSAPHYLGLHLITLVCTSLPSSLHLITLVCTSLPWSAPHYLGLCGLRSMYCRIQFCPQCMHLQHGALEVNINICTNSLTSRTWTWICT